MMMRASVIALFPPGVTGAELTSLEEGGNLFPCEEEAVARAVPRRAREFAAGRACAREALRALGHPAVAVPRRPDRSPAWPRGVVGSISHCDGYCGAVAGWRRSFAGLGFDVESRGRVEARLWPLLASEPELADLQKLESRDAEEHATLLFSAKEAFYKAQHAVTGRFLDSRAVSVSVEGGGSLRIRLNKNVRGLAHPRLGYPGRYHVEGRHVFTAAAIPTGAAGA